MFSGFVILHIKVNSILTLRLEVFSDTEEYIVAGIYFQPNVFILPVCLSLLEKTIIL
jgi:hypothetical protein